MSSQAFFAIVPAAGDSRRMGRNKLMLPWQGRPILHHVLSAWRASDVDAVLAVVRADDDPVRSVCQELGVKVLCPTPRPRDMKESIQHGLRFLQEDAQPTSGDRFLIAPADMPRLSSDLINQVVRASNGRDEIVLPCFGEHLGHPVSLPWTLAADVFELPEHAGINRIVFEQRKFVLELPAAEILTDVDTPEDYRRLCD
ncbi:nucleotidyltransferase family protein [Roseiconus nitratireducens]|uniref:Nucleotidyltransferase family protein n=1 Tax=Roseiconus nitratireducens TaxID=2605748 RepID=A0A5M6DH25_9BACT|nr:nucleotidyltransferase family protein [Roseiconus nitratireducens]KAA5546857.1 nucleotidyltransferase family protein [Roseiconus nitratireducens]